jgi:phage tail sheath protein FI
LNEAGVNVVRVFPARGIRVYGARTLAVEADHKLLNVRRLLIQLRRSLRRALAWVPFEPDNTALRTLLRACLEGFLETWWRSGKLAGATQDQAFRVAFDPPGALGEGTLLIHIAVAPVKPAEFVILTLKRIEEAIEVGEPAVSAGGVP